jgi:hypothetical protein
MPLQHVYFLPLISIADRTVRDGDAFDFHEDDSIQFNFTMFTFRSFLNELRKDPEVDRCLHNPPYTRIQVFIHITESSPIFLGFFCLPRRLHRYFSAAAAAWFGLGGWSRE